MVLMTFREVLDMVLVTLALGFIFMPMLQQPRTVLDILHRRFSSREFFFAALITAPAILLHELAHKFVAIFFGISAVFKAWFFGLGLGIFLSLIRSPLIIIAPGYVQIAGGTGLQQAAIAFAGPGINLLLYIVAFFVLRYKRKFSRTEAIGWHLTKQINIFLFFFNLLPIPPLDGSKVFGNLFSFFF